MNSDLSFRRAAMTRRDTPPVPRTIIALLTAILFLSACSNSRESAETSATSSRATSVTVENEPAPGSEQQPDRSVVGRTNVQASGNRFLPGALDLGVEPTTIDLPFVAVWILPLMDGSLIAVGADGTATLIAPDQTMTALDPVDASVAPLAVDVGRGEVGREIVLVPNTEGVASDLPDTHEVQAGDVRAWFDGATDRVPHGALGDTTEATRLIIVRRSISDPMDDTGEPLLGQEQIVVDLEDDPTQSVFEGLAPLLADVDGDGVIDVLTTISDGETGARLAVFSIDGQPIAESEPVGQGNRWRHQVAVAPTGPNGEIEVIEIQTPHIGGLLQFQRFDGEALSLQHRIGDFRSHVLRSRNLDGAVVFDGDNDGKPEAVVPTQDLGAIAVVDAVPADELPMLIDLGGATVSSNLALGEIETGLRFAVALSDGRLLVW